MKRRDFIGDMALALGGGWLLSALPESVLSALRATGIQPGFQTFPIREMLSKDFAGTLKMMADMGYKVTEMCSPKGYEKAGYAPLIPIPPSELRKTIEDAGLTCPSCHFGFGEFSDERLSESITFAKGLGLNNMICSSFGLPKTATLNDYLAAADQLNKAAEAISKAGMQAGYHNHSTEFEQLDGQLIYDALMSRFDPKLVKMQFQTEVINKGYKGADYFRKYPGRFISAHLSDWTAEKKQVPVGKGVIDWKEFFNAAKTGGVKTFFVEMDMPNFKESAAYLRSV